MSGCGTGFGSGFGTGRWIGMSGCGYGSGIGSHTGTGYGSGRWIVISGSGTGSGSGIGSSSCCKDWGESMRATRLAHDTRALRTIGGRWSGSFSSPTSTCCRLPAASKLSLSSTATNAVKREMIPFLRTCHRAAQNEKTAFDASDVAQRDGTYCTERSMMRCLVAFEGWRSYWISKSLQGQSIRCGSGIRCLLCPTVRTESTTQQPLSAQGSRHWLRGSTEWALATPPGYRQGRPTDEPLFASRVSVCGWHRA